MATYASISGLDPQVVSDFLLQGVYENAILSLQGLGPVREDIEAEAGATVRVPVLGRSTVTSGAAPGSALTPTDTPISNVEVTVAKDYVYEQTPREVFEDQKSVREMDLLQAHGEALAEAADIAVFAALDAATPTVDVDLATAGDLTDLYDKIVDAKQGLRAQKGRPSHVIVHPDGVGQLLKETSEGVKNRSITLTPDGKSIATVAGLTLVETANANANAATLDLVQAIVIDERRSFAEAWGRRPDSRTDFLLANDEFEHLTTQRHGAAVVDAVAGVAHVANPSV